MFISSTEYRALCENDKVESAQIPASKRILDIIKEEEVLNEPVSWNTRSVGNKTRATTLEKTRNVYTPYTQSLRRY